MILLPIPPGLPSAVAAPVLTIPSTQFSVMKATFSPDELVLATAGADGTVILWNTSTLRKVRTIRTGTDAVSDVAFSPDGLKIVTVAGDVRTWSARTGRLLRTISSREPSSASFLANDRLIVGGGKSTSVVGLGPSAVTRTLSDFPCSYLAASEDKRRLFGVADGRLHVWTAPMLEEIKIAPLPKETFIGAAFVGRTHVICVVDERSVTLVDPDRKTARKTFRHRSTLNSSSWMAVDAKGTRVYIGDQTQEEVYDLASGNRRRPLGGGGRHTYSLKGRYAVREVFGGNTLPAEVGVQDLGRGLWHTIENAAPLATQAAATMDGKAILVTNYRPTEKANGFLADWDVERGALRRTYVGDMDDLHPGVVSPVADLVALADIERIHLYQRGSGRLVRTLDTPFDRVNSVAFSPDGTTLLAVGRGDGPLVWEAGTGRLLHRAAMDHSIYSSARFSPRGNEVAFVDQDAAVVRWSMREDRPPATDAFPGHSLNSVEYSPGGTYLIASLDHGALLISSGGSKFPVFAVHGGQVRSASFSPDGRYALTGSEDGLAIVWDLADRKPRRRILVGTGILSARFDATSRRVLTVGRDGITQVWDVATGDALCSLVSFMDGSWAVTDPAGRFDVADFNHDTQLSWVASDAPFRALPVEIFMREYYEPGLLAKIWRGENLSPVRSLADLNRAQPGMKVDAKTEGDEATVTLAAGKGTAEFERDGKRGVQTGSPQDVRLFLDGQLVAHEDGPLGLDAQGRWTKSYHVALPHNGEKSVEVSAYCFNQDRVKSDTVRETLKLDLPRRQGKAYVICAGVDRYARADLSLHYSAADATTISETLKARLKGYAEVVAVPLLSDETHHDATKAKFRAVLDSLAGRPADLKGVPNGERLAKATPEDLVIVSWSGHGLASKEGRFYLLPEDVRDDSDTFGKAFLASCVSTDDLTAWLRDVRAADTALIVDACHSAAAVQSEEFKPGPLGNRGLGQLAYDKGIRVLAATQAENVALESDRLGNGLLTYALVHDGLSDGKVPSLKAWLMGAVEDVPRLYEALSKGTLRAVRALPDTEGAGPAREFRQRPALFDYTRRESPVPFVAPKS